MQTVAERIRAEERREGRKEASQRILLSQMALKFDTVPDTRHQQIVDASLNELDAWLAKVLTASDVDEVFSTAS